VALGLFGTARWAAWDSSTDSRSWPAITALAYCGVTAGLFIYLGTDRAREALSVGTASSVAAARIIVALSPTAVVSVLHLAGADIRVASFALGSTLVQLVIWSEIVKKRHTVTSRE
jgi:hypothetical protein